MELIINVAIKEQMDKHTQDSEIYDVLSCALETIKDRDAKLAELKHRLFVSELNLCVTRHNHKFYRERSGVLQCRVDMKDEFIRQLECTKKTKIPLDLHN